MVARRIRAQPAPGGPSSRTVNRIEAAAEEIVSNPSGDGRVVSLRHPGDLILTEILSKAKRPQRNSRGSGSLHVSDLLSRCIRKKALSERFSLPTPVEWLSLVDSITFRQGEGIHDVIRERSASGAPGSVWGKWKCVCGGLRTEEPCTAEELPSTVCEYCNSAMNIYVEVSIHNEEHDIVGHPDLLLYMEDLDAFYVNELKSISHEQYKTLVRPKPDHTLQVLFYWYLMHKKGYTLVNQVSMLYVTKGYTFKGTPYTEFTIDVPSAIGRLEPYLKEAKALMDSRTGGELPDRISQCASIDSPEARKCPLKDRCFGVDNGPTVKVSISQARRGVIAISPQR